MSITSFKFGTLNCGKDVTAYMMTSKCGISVTILDLGGVIQSIKCPDKNGNVKDIVCGYDTPQEYLEKSGYQGALIGRYANRIENGTFTLNGKTYVLPKNEKGITTLHGGKVGFDKKIWNVEAGQCKCGADKLVLTCVSEDGEEGFPGKVDVKVVYRLTDDGEFAIRYFATPDAETPIAMTNHVYFNLAGYETQSVLNQELTLNCDKIVAVNGTLIPTELRDVAGTPFYFRTAKRIGKDILDVSNDQTAIAGGYDHTFVISTDKKLSWNHGLELAETAILFDPESGRKLTVYTDAPGIQVYSGNFLGEYAFKGGVQSKKHGAICLETGFYPNTPNRPDFPSCIFSPEKPYECTAVFKFEF